MAERVHPRQASPQFPPVIDLSLTAPDIEIAGTASLDHSGHALCSGDINGDGNLDLVIVSYAARPMGGLRNGEVEIIWGSDLQQPGLVDMADTSATLSRIFGKSSDNPIFARLACGDFNNDGNDDIIYAHPFGQNVFADGMAYVIFGSSNFPDTLDLEASPTNVVTILGGPFCGSLGRAVAACDMNNDGYDEIIISAPRIDTGQVYIIHGGTTFLPTYDMGQAPPGVTRVIDDISLNKTGESLACSDVDKDGHYDLLIGSEGLVAGARYGMATLLYGQAVLPDTLVLSDPSFRIKKIYGEPYSDGRLGHQVAIGDVNNDDKDDLILAAPWADPLGCFDCGEIYVMYDANQLPDSSHVGSSLLPITRLLGTANFFNWGIELLSADVTGDNFAEIIVGTFGENASPTPLASVVVIYGDVVLPDSVFLDTDTLVTRILGASIGDRLGVGMTSGDFDKNNVNDLVLGADWADPLGRANAGASYLFYGDVTPTGINSRPAFPSLILFQNQPNPFSRTTHIEYELSRSAPVTLSIYNVKGQLVTQIAQGLRPVGQGFVDWNGVGHHGRRVASGVYFYRLKAGPFSHAKKMLLIR